MERIRDRISARVAIAGLVFVLAATPAVGWNLGAKHVNALIYRKDGSIRFTLFDEGAAGEEFRCSGRDPWLQITACPANAEICRDAVQRMGSALLAAKLAGRPVHVKRSECDVTEIALKP